VVRRRVRGQWGSMQVFVEQALDEGSRLRNKVRPPHPVHWNRQVFMMRTFDRLIYNTDRNMGNILMAPDGRLWMIDHTRAFRRHDQLKDTDLVHGIDRGVWKRLREVDDETLHATVRPYLTTFELDGLLNRRKALIALIEQRIAEMGEKEVLFDVYGAAGR